MLIQQSSSMFKGNTSLMRVRMRAKVNKPLCQRNLLIYASWIHSSKMASCVCGWSSVTSTHSARHPAIQPKINHIVDLIIRYYHEVCGHSGLEHTLSLIRQRYWIINPRTAVRHIVNQCRQLPQMSSAHD